MVTMFVFGVLANAARHEPEAIAALRAARPGPASPGCCGCRCRPAATGPGRAARQRRGAPVPMTGPSVVVAGGGQRAGTSSPRWPSPTPCAGCARTRAITALGTERGLDTTLIPARGYPLELIPPVPLPRKPSGRPAAAAGPGARARSRRVREVLAAVDADVVVGFGGYVALPAYLGARGRVPIVVHEANARAGLANKVGARFAARVAAAVPGSGLPGAEVVGIPLRRSITGLDRPALRAQARRALRAARRRARCCWCSAARRARGR